MPLLEGAVVGTLRREDESDEEKLAEAGEEPCEEEEDGAAERGDGSGESFEGEGRGVQGRARRRGMVSAAGRCFLTYRSTKESVMGGRR